MNFRTNIALNIQFELLKEVPYECIPFPIAEQINNYLLKSRIGFKLSSGNTIQVPTGIRILSFPEFTFNQGTTQAINMYTEGTCTTYERNEIKYGIRTLGPSIVTKSYPGEITVTLKNDSNTIFECEPGDAISVLSFNLKPFIAFNIDQISQSVPNYMR